MSSRPSRATPILLIPKKSQLIECVKARSCLWDHHCEAFKSSSARQTAFNEIVNELSDSQNQYTRTQIQEEWGKIRYCFTRIMKKFLTAEDDTDAVSWPHWQEMQFMYDTIKEHLLATGLASAFGHSSKRYRKYSTAFSLIQKSNMIGGMPKTSPFVSNNMFSVLKTRNLRKRRYNRLMQQHADSLPKHEENQEATYSCSPSPTASTGKNVMPISSAAAKVLLNLGIDPSISTTENGSSIIKSEEFVNTIVSNGDDENGVGDHRFLSLSTPNSEKYTRSESSENWENFLTSNASDALNALTFPHNISGHCVSSEPPKSPLQLPSTSTGSAVVSVAVNSMLNCSNGAEFRSGLPSIESNEVSTNDQRSSDASDPNRETHEFFGKYMVQQMQAVFRKNPTLGVLLKKELMEVCCKYELQAFT